MKRAALRSLSLYTRNFLLISPKLSLNPNPSLAPLAALTRSRLIFYSSESDPPTEKNNSFAAHQTTQKPNESIDDVDDVSNQELKRRIAKFYEGDKEVLPSIFEAILKRKLAGIEDDDELMEWQKPRTDDDVKAEFDSDFEDWLATNEGIDDFDESDETSEESSDG